MELILTVKNKIVEVFDGVERTTLTTDLKRGDPENIRQELVANEHRIEKVSIKLPNLSPSAVDEVAEKLSNYSVPFAVSVNIKGSHDFDQLQYIGKLLEFEDLPYSFTAKAKVKDDSPVNVNKPETWTDPVNVKFAIGGALRVKDRHAAVTLLETLKSEGYNFTATIKPRFKQETLFEEGYLDLLPDESEITVTLQGE